MTDAFSHESLTTAHLYEQVADLMEREIIARHMEGEELPGEQALALRFHVSRASIREAMKLLRERGLVDSRRGSVSLVTKPEAGNVSAMLSRIILMDGIDYNDIYDVRILMETETARLAALRADEKDLAAMREQLNMLRDRGIPTRLRRDTDFAFHLRIAQAAGNRLLVLLVETMSNIFKEMINAGIFVLGGIDDAIVRHEKIYRALEKHSPDEAQTAMLEHLEQSRKHVAAYAERLKAENNQAAPSANERSE